MRFLSFLQKPLEEADYTLGQGLPVIGGERAAGLWHGMIEKVDEGLEVERKFDAAKPIFFALATLSHAKSIELE
jgi:hypothetical protein